MFHFRTAQERNFWFMYLEAFFAPFTGIAGAFAGAYAIRLGATNTEIGLMSSIPPLLVILVSIPFGRILQTSSKKLFFISIYALVAVPIQLFNIGNVGMMIDIVPDDHRAAVFTVRNVIGSLVNTLLLNVGMWMVGPLHVLYTVRQLAASDAWIGTAGTIASICALVGWLAGRRLIKWWGNTVTHRRLVLLMGIYAAIFNTIKSIGPFIFPLVGVNLSAHFGISPTLIGCGMLALL